MLSLSSVLSAVLSSKPVPLEPAEENSSLEGKRGEGWGVGSSSVEGLVGLGFGRSQDIRRFSFLPVPSILLRTGVVSLARAGVGGPETGVGGPEAGVGAGAIELLLL